ncbi:hypothetical protein [Allorhizobium ampelinum]|uniref:hypothetical protein n=1 Tax=Allorhizobium ampelinum TaxID=3025782 RepID=UPI0002DC875D|nr:hypothetical protein [Allorhizobium ampelinum]
MAHAIRHSDATPEQVIRTLARQHGIVAERNGTDDMADTITRLSGDDVIHDEIEDLLVTMQRKGVITDVQANALYGNYLASA